MTVAVCFVVASWTMAVSLAFEEPFPEECMLSLDPRMSGERRKEENRQVNETEVLLEGNPVY